MGTTAPWRTPFGSAQRAHSNHPPPGSDKPIIKGLLRVPVPIREVLDHAHVDPSPLPQGFALLGQALNSDQTCPVSYNETQFLAGSAVRLEQGRCPDESVSDSYVMKTAGVQGELRDDGNG